MSEVRHARPSLLSAVEQPGGTIQRIAACDNTRAGINAGVRGGAMLPEGIGPAPDVLACVGMRWRMQTSRCTHVASQLRCVRRTSAHSHLRAHPAIALWSIVNTMRPAHRSRPPWARSRQFDGDPTHLEVAHLQRRSPSARLSRQPRTYPRRPSISQHRAVRSARCETWPSRRET